MFSNIFNAMSPKYPANTVPAQMEMMSLETDMYTPYEGLNLVNQICRKLGVFDRKLEGSYFIFLCYFDIILEIQKR